MLFRSLVETKAPANFVLDSTPKVGELKAVFDEEAGEWVWTPVDFGKIQNIPVIPPNLPTTGGVGVLVFLLIAGGAGVAAVGGQTWKRRKSS